MKTKLIYAAVLLVCLFGSASATSRQQEGIRLVYQPEENGDFSIYLFPQGKVLVCEERSIRLIEPQDPTHQPLVLECSHGKQAGR